MRRLTGLPGKPLPEFGVVVYVEPPAHPMERDCTRGTARLNVQLSSSVWNACTERSCRVAVETCFGDQCGSYSVELAAADQSLSDGQGYAALGKLEWNAEGVVAVEVSTTRSRVTVMLPNTLLAQYHGKPLRVRAWVDQRQQIDVDMRVTLPAVVSAGETCPPEDVELN